MKLAVVLFLFLVINLLTADRSPTVWTDEVMYSDPAFNLAAGDGFTSSVWAGQSFGSWWAGNVPLHEFLLAGWIRIWGRSITAVRSFDFALTAIAVAVLWEVMRKSGMVEREGVRLAACGLILLGHGMAFSYRSARPDAITLLLAALLAWAFVARSPRIGNASSFVLGGLFVWAGLQCVPALAVASAAGILAWRGRRLRCCALGAGLAMGAVTLLAVYHRLGAWAALLKSVRAHATLDSSAQTHLMFRWAAELLECLSDPSLVLVWLALVFIAIACGARDDEGRLRPWLVLAAFSLATAVISRLAVHFRIYYSWMAFVPAVIALAWAWETSLAGSAFRFRFLRTGVVITAGLAACMGLPARLGVMALDWRNRDYGPVMALARQTLHPGDRVYASAQAYYAVRSVGARPFDDSYWFSPAERKALTAAMLPPGSAGRIQAALGGEWVETGHGVHAAKSILASIPWLGSAAAAYDLEVYRRKGSP